MSSSEVLQQINATRDVASATLAAAIISNMGRPVSVAEAMAILRDVQFSLYPGDLGNGRYKNWKETANLDTPRS